MTCHDRDSSSDTVRSLSESEIVEPSNAETDQLARLARALDAIPAGSEGTLVGPDEAPIALTPSLLDVLVLALAALRSGRAVAISPLKCMLTTTEAGDLLGASRQYLTRLIEAGEIPCGFTGGHRRIKLADLLSYKRARDARRAELHDEMTLDASSTSICGRL